MAKNRNFKMKNFILDKIHKKYSSIKIFFKQKNRMGNFLIASVAAAVALFFAGLNWNNIFNKQDDNNYSVDLRGNTIEERNFQILGDNILGLSDTHFNILAEKKENITAIPHNFAKTASKVNGNNIITYWDGGKKYHVGDKRNPVISTKETSENIITASISESGVYAIVTKSNNFLAELTVYDSDNSEIYKYSFSDVFVSDIDISSDGKILAVSGIHVVDGDILTKLYVLSVTDTNPMQKIELEDNTVATVKIINEQNVVAIGNNYTSFINCFNGRRKDIDYNQRVLVTLSIKPNSAIVLVLSSVINSNNYNIQVFDTDGNIKSQFSVSHKVNSINTYDDIVAVLTGATIEIYKDTGEHYKSLEVDTDIKKILLKSTDGVYALTFKNIKYFQL